MGMSIDEAINHLGNYSSTNGSGLTTDKQHNEAKRVAIDIMRKYQQLQADYETRLKADMVAMLTEMQLEFEENTVRWYAGRVDGKSDDVVLMETINDIIQQKIDKLKEGTT